MRKTIIIVIILIIMIVLYNIYAYYSAFESDTESVWIEKIDVIGDEYSISGYIIDDYLVVKGVDIKTQDNIINITILKGLRYFPNFKKETMTFNINLKRPEDVTKILLTNSWESKVLWAE